MERSIYNKFIEHTDDYYVYNSLSNALLKVNKELFQILEDKSIDINFFLEENFIDIKPLLYESKVITDNNKDDKLLVKYIVNQNRNISNLLNLTITPTMDCNFSCPYCFETKEEGVMSDESIDNIVNFVNNYNGIKSLNLTWFGGEPLLEPNIISKVTSRIKSDITLRASIVTNGYYLTEENINLLIDNKIDFIQVSIDGINELHNKNRFTENDKNTFDVIMANIEKFLAIDSNIKLSLRVSVTKDNINAFHQAYNFLTDKFNNSPRIIINPAFIIETTKSCHEGCVTNAEDKLIFKKN